MDTGLKQNKQGKLVAKDKKITPQQKKLEKMQGRASMESFGDSDSSSGGGKGGGNGGKKGEKGK